MKKLYEYENLDEEFCKWKMNPIFRKTINNPHVPGRERISTVKYCPYCGRKIRIVASAKGLLR